MNPPVRILHLEDDPADARLIREQLRRSGLDAAITLVDGPEAFQTALSNGGFDVVLSDYHMPRFNGLEALELVKGAAPRLPFILVTGALGDERAVDLLKSGATDFVLKDRLARLVPAIQRALSEQVARRQNERAQAQLGEAARLSKLAAEAAHMGTWHLEVASGKLECSEEFLALIGVSSADWAGTLDALEEAMHPDDVERCRRSRVAAVDYRQFMELEFRVARPEGGNRWMYLRGDCSLGANGVPAKFLGVMIDITERKLMEEALLDADRQKDEFLATLAHELRNPLAPIYNGLAILRRSPEKTSDLANVHAILERQMNHIIRLVDDLLDISRFKLGKIELKRKPVELRTIVNSAVEMSQPLIEAGRHRLEISLPADPVILHVDAVRLTQVLSNLLNNAAKYTNDGGQIWLHAGVKNDRILMSVRDNGVGIPESMLEGVFDLFTQVDGFDQAGRLGLGIGLAMARLLVQLHEGHIEARSAGPGKGSEFVVYLPLPALDYAVGGKVNTSARDIGLSDRRVLVVDDNRDSADSLSMLLKLAGANVHVAYDGVSALEAIPAYHPDVVVLDIGMPGMDGYTVATRIRQESQYRHIKLIALTGFGQEDDRVRSSAAGFDYHLTKPADFNVVQTLLASLKPTGQSRPHV